jgi:UDP-MurNAc hydroxylase
MKITHLKSSTELIEANGVRILTDPWLTDGEYYGSWFHYPAYDKPISDLDVDFIYISHIHPDHLSIKTLQQLNKSIPVLIHHYAQDFLKRNIMRLGFQVMELPHNQRTHLKNGVYINILAADNCDPQLCSKFMGCAPMEKNFGSTQIDSLCVIDNGEYTLLNTNDCPYDLSRTVIETVLSSYGKIHFLLVGYAGAGPYPQCFHFNDPAQQVCKAEEKKLKFLEMGLHYIRHIQPKFFMPFAGTYTLGGRLVKLNDLRGVPDIQDAFDYLIDKVSKENLPCQGVLLNTHCTFDLNKKTSSSPYRRSSKDEKQTYINTVLVPKKFTYESDPMPSAADIQALLGPAHERFERKRHEIGFVSNTQLLIDIDEESVININCGQQGGYTIMSRQKAYEQGPYVNIGTDPRLLRQILSGPKYAHWNNAEIGSHLRYVRVPDIFERGMYHSLCFFHV